MVDSRVYAVASGKGGVGKTTTAVGVAACAAAAGRSAVAVDADLGMGNLASLVGVDDAAPTLHDVLAGDAAVAEAVRPAPGGFDVVPSGDALEGYAAADPSRLGAVLDALRGEYDVVVLDTGAGLSHDTVLPLGLADEVVLVTTAAAISVENTETTRAVAERIDADVRGAVVTRAVGDAADEAAEGLGTALLGTIPQDDAVGRAARAGVPVTVHDPDCPAARAYATLTASLLGVAVTEIRLSESDDTFDASDGPGLSLGGAGSVDPTPVDDGPGGGDDAGGAPADTDADAIPSLSPDDGGDAFADDAAPSDPDRDADAADADAAADDGTTADAGEDAAASADGARHEDGGETADEAESGHRGADEPAVEGEGVDEPEVEGVDGAADASEADDGEVGGDGADVGEDRGDDGRDGDAVTADDTGGGETSGGTETADDARGVTIEDDSSGDEAAPDDRADADEKGADEDDSSRSLLYRLSGGLLGGNGNN